MAWLCFLHYKENMFSAGIITAISNVFYKNYISGMEDNDFGSAKASASISHG
jgi:hypothetical protein